MSALEQVRGVISTLQSSMMVLLTKVVSNVSLQTLTILAKRLILDAWLVPGLASSELNLIRFHLNIEKNVNTDYNLLALTPNAGSKVIVSINTLL